MKYLKRFNEGLTNFQNANDAVETIDFYIRQFEDEDFNIEKIPGWGFGWDILNIEEDKIVYYFRVFPDEIPEDAKKRFPTDYAETFIPRIDCSITTKIGNVDSLKELYNQIKFLPQTLLNDDLYAKISFNDDNGESSHCFIHLTVYSKQEDLDESNEIMRKLRSERDQ